MGVEWNPKSPFGQHYTALDDAAGSDPMLGNTPMTPEQIEALKAQYPAPAMGVSHAPYQPPAEPYEDNWAQKIVNMFGGQ